MTLGTVRETLGMMSSGLAATTTEADDVQADSPFAGRRGFVFFTSIIYLLALGAIAVMYFTETIDPRKRIGTIPTPVPWFGALGAVLISLTGIFDHVDDWRPSYRYWHWARPFVGATVAVIAVLIFQAGVLAVGEEVKPEGTTTKDVFYYVIAFFIGYQEAAFRELMARVGEVVVRPGGTTDTTPSGRRSEDAPRITPAPTISGVDPPSASAAGGTPVTISGTGLGETKAVRFDGAEVTAFEAVADGYIRLWTPAGAVGPVVITVVGRNDRTAEHDFEFT